MALRIASTLFGELRYLADDDRDRLLATLAAWFDADGSTRGAAAALCLHANTVRNRLHRLEQLTGRSLAKPNDAAEMALALRAVRLR